MLKKGLRVAFVLRERRDGMGASDTPALPWDRVRSTRSWGRSGGGVGDMGATGTSPFPVPQQRQALLTYFAKAFSRSRCQERQGRFASSSAPSLALF